MRVLKSLTSPWVGLLFLALVVVFVPFRAQAAPPLQTCTIEQVRATQRYWFFGDRGAMNFGVSGTTATAFQNPQPINTMEGSTVVTDTDGELLFWSNGLTVYNTNHQAMPNGSGLLGNQSATQTVASFPSVGNPGIYFVITTTGSESSDGNLYYSVVDMSLNGGLGNVTTKNVLLGTAGVASEALSAVPNADGTGFWVITHTRNSPNILAYEFDENGPVTGNAVVSTMSSNNLPRYGTFNFSQDLTKLVQISSAAGVGQAILRVLDFDATTGQITELVSWNMPTGVGTGQAGYSADFSPDGNWVYATKINNNVSGGGQLYRYNIATYTTQVALEANVESLGTAGGVGGQVRRAPDGRLYVADDLSTALGVVNDPNHATNPNFVVGGFPLAAGSTSRYGLPQTATGCPIPVPDYEVIKSSNPTPGLPVHPGEIIIYTLSLRNISGEPQTNLSFSDDLSGIIGNATYNNNATATAGVVTFNAPNQLAWQGDLAVDGTATITYSVTIKGSAPIGAILSNVVIGERSTCYASENDGCHTEHTVVEGLANTGQNVLLLILSAGVLIITGLWLFMSKRLSNV